MMASITCLPDEVITLILEDYISIEDVRRFRSTCKRFQKITQRKRFWEKKFYQSFHSNIVRENQPERTGKIKFAVGMIVTHSSDLYLSSREYIHATSINHDGVIIGWHHKCWHISINESLDSMFPKLGNCDSYHHICTKFSDSVDKPHYIILSENNKICYVQQDVISICPPKRINNIEIELFFSSLKDIHYVPNEKLRRDYPSDTTAIPTILSNLSQ